MINKEHLLIVVYSKDKDSDYIEYIIHEHDILIEQVCKKLMKTPNIKYIDDACVYLTNKYLYNIKKQLYKLDNEVLIKLEIFNSTLVDLIIVKDMMRTIKKPQVELIYGNIDETF